MNSKKNKEKDNRGPNPGTESKSISLARFFRKTGRFLKASDSESKANVKQRHEENDNPQGAVRVVTSGSQTIQENYGSNNRLHVGDDNSSNIGIIGHNSINILVQQLCHRSQAGENSTSIKLSAMITAVIFIDATQKILDTLFGNVIANSATEFDKKGSEGNIVKENFCRLVESIRSAIERDDRTIQQVLRDYLKDLWSELWREREQLCNVNQTLPVVEVLNLNIAWKLRLFLFLNHMGGYIPQAILVEGIKKRMSKVLRDVEAGAPRRWIKDLPRARTAYDEYVSSRERRVSCFEGTRQALLEEIGRWVSTANARIFVLFGLAGIGKSTIAQTVAERADNVRLLGASFFFSRDDTERRTAERFFTTVASQLCVHDPGFASAMEPVMTTEQGRDATRKFPLDQLEMLILEPLRNLIPRNVVIVVDALDECDAKDIRTILTGLTKLVQVLPSFRVILTTRPQQHLQFLRNRLEFQKVFDLHDIEDKVVDGDIERYLRHKFSLEEVKACLPNLREPWVASDDEIKSLVRAAGRLFIIASTAVLFILDETSTPAKRMKLLLDALKQGYTPLKALNSFYTTILRSAVPENCEDDTRDCYQTMIGTIILIQQPLAVPALAKLIDVEVNEITAVLGNLQSVILLGDDDVPLTYHKSFPDYIQDPTRCKDEDLRIDPKPHHARMAIHCLRLLNRHLKQNILDLGDPARFMDNGEALKKHGLTENHFQEKLPMELQYACLYFSDHMKSADIEDAELAKELVRFFNEHFLNWLEALSWIEKLDSSHRTLFTVKKQLVASDLCELIDDGLRFISKFYQHIKRSALHTYHSALPLIPAKTSLYKRYAKQMTFCQVSASRGQERWDELIATFESGSSRSVRSAYIVFSGDGTLFASSVGAEEIFFSNSTITIYDAVTSMPLGRIGTRDNVFAISNDFSKAAVYDIGSITLYNLKSFLPVATIRPSALISELTLSPDGSILVAESGHGSLCLRNTEDCEEIESYGGWEKRGRGFTFSPDYSRAAFVSEDKIVLLDGKSGKIVAGLEFPELNRSTLMFSGDGSRLACLSSSQSAQSLRAWNSQDGSTIGTAADAGDVMAISTDGSRLLTALRGSQKLRLFSGNNLALLEILDINIRVWSIAIHDDLIGVGSPDYVLALYGINSHACIAQLPFTWTTSLAFSPNGKRLAAANIVGDVQVWDVPSIAPSDASLQALSELAFSPDCSRLASGHHDGTIKLWNTANMAEVAPILHMCHSNLISALAFNVQGEEFASASVDGIIKLWNGKDGTLVGVLEDSNPVYAVALSGCMLAAAMQATVTLWDLKSRNITATLDAVHTDFLTFSHGHSLLATAAFTYLTLWDTNNQELVTTFELSDDARGVHSMTFLQDNSQFAVRDYNCHSYLFNIPDDLDIKAWESKTSKPEASKLEPENQDISRLGLNLHTIWHGIPVWTHQDRNRDRGANVVGRFPQQEDVVVFNIPSTLRVEKIVEGSSMIALGCEDGRIMLIKAASS